MFGLLVAVIYLSFISLGLPDSLLGAAWPVMSGELGAPIGLAGVISLIISAGTIVSSLLSDRLTKRFGAGTVTAISTLLTAVALLLFSFASEFWQLALFAIPYGLGAGGVDAALNNYVALHLKSRHMSWLHCMWGVGASVSPYIMSYALAGAGGWSRGYLIVAIVQGCITLMLFLSLPLWKRPVAPGVVPAAEGGRNYSRRPVPLKEVFRVPGAAMCFLCFFCYCALESSTSLWASSYMIAHGGFSEERAAMFASLFFIGITAGRGINGFLTFRFSDRTLIRAGCVLMAAGVALIIPSVSWLTIAGFVVLGLGCAPVYPGIIHSTPSLFGADKSQAIIGMQMAFAYIGSQASPLFGAIAQAASPAILPAYLAFFLVLVVVFHELTVRGARRAKLQKSE
ncbi:MAG TPA: MFS transporter [Candidatus Coproplasma avistercoris]|nr:MFS transporter [Candidatus Coproplasma avistercoris]